MSYIMDFAKSVAKIVNDAKLTDSVARVGLPKIDASGEKELLITVVPTVVDAKSVSNDPTFSEAFEAQVWFQQYVGTTDLTKLEPLFDLVENVRRALAVSRPFVTSGIFAETISVETTPFEAYDLQRAAVFTSVVTLRAFVPALHYRQTDQL